MTVTKQLKARIRARMARTGERYSGLGAGYILWEFAHDDGRVVVLGFTHSWQYFDRRLGTTVDRLGLDVAWSRTGGSAGAAGALASALAAGDPAIIWPDQVQREAGRAQDGLRLLDVRLDAETGCSEELRRTLRGAPRVEGEGLRGVASRADRGR